MTVDYYIKMALENGSFQYNLISSEPVEDSENENERVYFESLEEFKKAKPELYKQWREKDAL